MDPPTHTQPPTHPSAAMLSVRQCRAEPALALEVHRRALDLARTQQPGPFGHQSSANAPFCLTEICCRGGKNLPPYNHHPLQPNRMSFPHKCMAPPRHIYAYTHMANNSHGRVVLGAFGFSRQRQLM